MKRIEYFMLLATAIAAIVANVGLVLTQHRIRALETLAIAERKNVHEIILTLAAMEKRMIVPDPNPRSVTLTREDLQVKSEMKFSPAVNLDGGGYYYPAPK